MIIMTRNEPTKAKRQIKKPHLRAGTAVSVNTSGHFMITAAQSACIALAVAIIVLLVLCAVCMALDDPTKYASMLARIALVPASLTAGVLCAKRSGAGGIPSGAAAGGLLTGVLFLMGALIPSAPDTVQTAAGQSGITEALLIAAICVLLSCIGGYAVTHKKPKTHRKMHH